MVVVMVAMVTSGRREREGVVMSPVAGGQVVRERTGNPASQPVGHGLDNPALSLSFSLSHPTPHSVSLPPLSLFLHLSLFIQESRTQEAPVNPPPKQQNQVTVFSSFCLHFGPAGMTSRHVFTDPRRRD